MTITLINIKANYIIMTNNHDIMIGLFKGNWAFVLPICHELGKWEYDYGT